MVCGRTLPQASWPSVVQGLSQAEWLSVAMDFWVVLLMLCKHMFGCSHRMCCCKGRSAVQLSRHHRLHSVGWPSVVQGLPQASWPSVVQGLSQAEWLSVANLIEKKVGFF